jgi:hypothetical protein
VTPEAAGELARDALIWVAGRRDAIGRFLAESGIGPAELAARADEAETRAAVLDFLLADERLLLAFAAEAGIDPALPGRARACLPGGGAPHWT